MSATTAKWVQLSRRLGLDGNPMRRPADKIQAWLRPAAVAVFLALCPVVAAGASTWAHAGLAAARRAELSWRPVRAVLLQAAPGPAEADGGANTWTVWVAAEWSIGGRQETGAVPVAAGSPAGSTHTVLLNRAGAVQAPPESASQAAGLADTATALGLAALAMMLAAATWLIRRALDRRTLARWERAWLTAGPRWSRGS